MFQQTYLHIIERAKTQPSRNVPECNVNASSILYLLYLLYFIYIAYYIMTTKNGSGIHGLQPKGGLLGGGGGSTGGSGMIGSSARGRNRSVLRKAFGKTIHTTSTAYLRSQNTNNKKQD